MSDTSGTNGPGAQGSNGAGLGQEPPATGQAGQEPPTGQQAPSGTDANTVDPTTIQDPTLRAYVEKVQADAKEAREQAARYRTERNTFQTQLTEHQRANETAEQAAQREATERQERLETLEAENRDLKVGTAVRTAALDAKAFNPALVAEMLKAKVTLDDKGAPTNLQDLIKGLRESDPYLFKRGANQDAGQGNGGDGAPVATSMNDVIRGQVAARRGGR